MRAVSVALAALVGLALTLPAASLRAQTPVPFAPAQCDVVSSDDAGKILGYHVGEADAPSRGAGICFYTTQGITENGLVSYAVVTAERLPQRRAYFLALARMCGNVAKVAPRAAVCATYVLLARAQTLEEYFAARTSGAAAEPVPDIGAEAIASDGALYVRRSGTVFEIVVRREQKLDVARSSELAKLLLQRIP